MIKKNFPLLPTIIFLCLLLSACTWSPSTDSHAPAVAHDPVNGRYLAVYLKIKMGNPDTGASDDSRLFGAFVDSNGSLLGSGFLISESSGDFYCPSIAFDSTQMKYLVIWNSEDSIYGQFINSDGSLSGSRLTLSNAAAAPCGRCSTVAYDNAARKFAAVWGEQNIYDHDNLYVQLINADGSLDGPKLAVSGDGTLPAYPSIAYDELSQRFLVVWDSADNRRIKGRLINPDGTFATDEFVISSSTGSHYVPTVSYDSVDARFLVSWEHTVDDTYFDLRGQQLNADGSLYQSVISISSPGRNAFWHKSVYNPSDNNYFVLFGDRSQELIYGQVVKSDGTLDTTVSNGNILVSLADYPGDREPALAFDSVNNRYFAGWEYRGGYYDIHGRIVNSNGSPAGDISVLSNGGEW